MQIGFIGTGAMGLPMVARLTDRFPGQVQLFDADPQVMQNAVTPSS